MRQPAIKTDANKSINEQFSSIRMKFTFLMLQFDGYVNRLSKEVFPYFASSSRGNFYEVTTTIDGPCEFE